MRCRHPARVVLLNVVDVAKNAWPILLFYILVCFFGGPLRTGDSFSYVETGKHPWLSFGAWQPTGYPWFIYFVTLLTQNIRTMVVFGFLLQLITFIWAFHFRLGKASRWLALAILLTPPSLIMCGTVWSECLFLTMIWLLAGLLDYPSANRWRPLALIGAFLILVEIRHPAIFLMPALGIAWGISHFNSRRRYFVIGAAFCALSAAWTGLNFARTGNPLLPTAGRFDCLQRLVALNEIDFCSWQQPSAICKFDDRGIIGRRIPSEAKLAQMGNLQYDESSPYRKFLHERGETSLCQESSAVMKGAIVNSPGQMFRIVWNAFLAQFGEWQSTERGDPIKIRPANLKRLDSTLKVWNLVQPIFYVLLFLSPGFFILAFQKRIASAVFLIGAAWGHALGIALSNPFAVLRYMEVSKEMLFVGCTLALVSFLKGRLYHNGIAQ
jgi:hypothetical protein